MNGDDWPELPLLENAACRESDPNLFFPQRGESHAPAVAICSLCPELGPCREWSMAAPAILQGIYGGWSQKRRRIERRRRKADISLSIDQVDMTSAPLELEAPASNGYHAPEVTARTCAGCSKPIDAGRKWCSDRCRRKHQPARARPKVVVREGALSAPAIADPREDVNVLSFLVSAGAQLVHGEFILAGQPLTIATGRKT